LTDTSAAGRVGCGEAGAGVACLVGGASWWPQLKQNFAAAGSSVEQLGQGTATVVPQWRQNLAPSGFAVWHAGQFIRLFSSFLASKTGVI
jgi:hypothetical protein